MELPTNYHKDGHLNVDVLFMKKIRLIVLSSMEDQYMHLESLFSKHTKYLLNILKQIIQSQRFKKVSPVLKRFLNIIKWSESSLHINLTKYIADHREHTNSDTGKEKNKLINQGVKTANDQYYNTHQESILSNTVTESNIYNNYSYTSCVNWEIDKTPETPSKKLEFNIDKPETGLKKIDFNIITNNNEIEDMNNNKIVHPSDDLADNVYNNIDYHNVQQEQTNHNSLYTLTNNELQLSSDLEDPNKADDWKSTNSHKGELVFAYNTKVGENTLHPRVFYTLYIEPNDNGNGHLIYKLSIDQILVTMK